MQLANQALQEKDSVGTDINRLVNPANQAIEIQTNIIVIVTVTMSLIVLLVVISTVAVTSIRELVVIVVKVAVSLLGL